MNQKPNPTGEYMKRYKIVRGKDDLNSTGGNYFCGLVLKGLTNVLPKDFQTRRRDAISIWSDSPPESYASTKSCYYAAWSLSIFCARRARTSYLEQAWLRLKSR
jgi:hypothetical protein